ncbi:hypothetical protein AADZ91_06780 [Colwelliaceae bacterium 6441]
MNIYEYQLINLFTLFNGVFIVPLKNSKANKPIKKKRNKMINKSLIFIGSFLLYGVLNLVHAKETATAKEAAIIVVEAHIYKFDEPPKLEEINHHLNKANGKDIITQLPGAMLEAAPRLMVEKGKPATIEIGVQEEGGNAIDMLKLNVMSNLHSDTYELVFTLARKTEEKISTIEAQLNTTLVISSSIGDEVKIAQIKTTQYKNKALAMAAINKK